MYRNIYIYIYIHTFKCFLECVECVKCGMCNRNNIRQIIIEISIAIIVSFENIYDWYTLLTRYLSVHADSPHFSHIVLKVQFSF